LRRDDEDLLVISESGMIENGRYKRESSIAWPLISLWVGMIPIGLLLVNHRASDQKILRIKFIDRIINTLIFFIGLGIAYSFWPWLPIWKIRIPWDGIISVEFGSATFILGVKLSRLDRLNDKDNPYFLMKYLKFVVAFLFGCSTSISFLGLFKIVLYMYYGAYP
jgi:hypothetical protein